MLDPEHPVPSRLIYIEWRDHSKEDGISFRAESPESFILKGYTNLVDETDEDYIVCQFVGRDEFCVFDRTAICKSDVVIMVNYGEL